MTSRLSGAVHILTLLAMAKPGESVCSDYLASSVNTNPVVIRRLLGLLRKAGLVVIQKGAHGGASLARAPVDIDLAEVYAVFEEPPFLQYPSKPNPGCETGRQVPSVLAQIFQGAERALQTELARTTLSDVVRAVRTRMAKDARAPRKKARSR